jgi:hypothetical protein
VVGATAKLRVARRDANGLSLPESGLRARIREGENTREITLRSTEPGMWEAHMAATAGVSHTVEILDAEGEVLAEQTFAPPPSAERRHRTADRSFLAAAAERTGGTVDADDGIDPPRAAAVTTDVDRLWPYLLLLALALLPVDAWLRRPARIV